MKTGLGVCMGRDSDKSPSHLEFALFLDCFPTLHDAWCTWQSARHGMWIAISVSGNRKGWKEKN
eukprot:711910-Amphidinium_carterae.1